MTVPRGSRWHRHRRWVLPLIAVVLATEVGYIVWQAVTRDAFDFYVYMWGGRAIEHGLRLYLKTARAHYFTYPPFAAALFAPMADLPFRLMRVLWQLTSLAGLGVAAWQTLRLAGLRSSRTLLAAVVAAALLLEPMRHTFWLGQINLMLLALILCDVSRVARGRWAGIGVGVATAIKLTPGVFVVLFLLARRTRSAVIAATTWAVCTGIGFLVAPDASRFYWKHLFHETKRVGVPYISNQSPYGAAVRLLNGVAHVGGWYVVLPVVLGVFGLWTATAFARRDEWLAAAAAAGATSLLVSPVSWSHHWVWALPALVLLAARGGRWSWIAAAGGYLLFAFGPMWWTPHFGGPHEYGFHWGLTLVANCYLVAGVAFLVYMAVLARRPPGDLSAPGVAIAALRADRSEIASVRQVG